MVAGFNVQWRAPKTVQWYSFSCSWHITLSGFHYFPANLRFISLPNSATVACSFGKRENLVWITVGTLFCFLESQLIVQLTDIGTKHQYWKACAYNSATVQLRLKFPANMGRLAHYPIWIALLRGKWELGFNPDSATIARCPVNENSGCCSRSGRILKFPRTNAESNHQI